jgi:hypothetical protein
MSEAEKFLPERNERVLRQVLIDPHCNAGIDL